MKLGLFGGTFNPIHFGHIKVAVEVQKYFSFDQLYFIPSRRPPHKSIVEIVPGNSRCEMIERSLPDGLPFSLSRIDLARHGFSYAIDTVKYFRSKLRSMDQMYFVLGIDAFLALHTWRDYQALVKQVAFIVVSRPGGRFLTNFLEITYRYILRKLSCGYCFSAYDSSWRHKYMKPIYYFKTSSPDISSTLIRSNVKVGEDFSFLVPLEVADYIRKKGLYL